MRTLHNREYLCRRGLGDREECGELMFAIEDELKALFSAHKINGGISRILEAPDEETYHPPSIVELTGGVFPAVWASVTFEPPTSPDDFAEMERKFDLVLTHENTRTAR